MKENKGKGLTIGDEVVQTRDDVPIQTHPHVLSALKLAPPISLEKRKTMSKKLDMGNLPSRQGNKRSRVDSSMPSKTPAVVVLNPTTPLTTTVQPPVASKADTPLPCPDVVLSNSSPKANPPEDGPMTLLRSENLAWSRFKQVVRNEDVSICYDMSGKEFEHSTIHDLFKVACLCPQQITSFVFNSPFKRFFFFFCKLCLSSWWHPGKLWSWIRRGSRWRQRSQT